MVHNSRSILSIGLHRADQSVRVGIPGVIKVGPVRPEPIAAIHIVLAIDTDIAGHTFVVKAGLETVGALDPGDCVGDIFQLVRTVERESRVEGERWSIGDVQPSLLGIVLRKPDVRNQIAHQAGPVARVNLRQGDGLSVGSLERSKLVSAELCLALDTDALMRAVYAGG